MTEIITLSLVYGLPILITLYLSIEIFSRNPLRRENQLVSLSIFCYTLIFIEELVRQYMPISYSPALVSLWLGNVAALIPCLSMHFIFRITGYYRSVPRWLYPHVFYILLIPVILTFFTGNIFNSTAFVHVGNWHVPILNTQYYISITIGNILLVVYFAILRSGMKRTGVEEQRRVFHALLYGVAFNTIWNCIFGYFHFPGILPPYPYLWGGLVWCLCLRITMLKYDFLSSSSKRFETLYNMNPAAIILLDEAGVIQEANPSAQRLLQSQNLVKRSFWYFARPQQREEMRRAYQQLFQSGAKMQHYEMPILDEMRQERIVLLDSDYVFIEHELFSMIIMRDITLLKEAEQQVRFLAYHDPLTGLPNRAAFYEHLEQMLRRSTKQAAVILLDLDGFKGINDTYGHQTGDAFLVHVAALLRRCTAAGGFAARLAGDEFIILIEGMDEPQVTAYAKTLHSIFEQSPFFYESVRFPVCASSGIAMFPDHGSDMETLIRSADRAMYEAKRNGKNSFHIWQEPVPATFT